MAGLIEVLAAGAASTVQDAGRPGLRRFGVPPSGPLDPVLLACANALAGNPPGTAALELRLTGPHLRVAAGRIRLALAGAAELTLAGGRRWGAWRSLTLEADEEVRVGRIHGTAYLAFSGGIDLAPVLGSRATHLRAGLGGLAGRSLQPGDRLPLGGAAPDGDDRCQQPFRHEDGPLRLLPGPQDDHFTPEARRRLVEEAFLVSHESDRMGLRLEGPRLAHAPGHGGEIVSDATVPGAIQVPPDGRAIVLLADAQTVGGYPKIACVIRADLPRLAQRLPGEQVRFVYVTRQAALAALQAQQAALAAWCAGIGPCPCAERLDERALYTENLISGVVFGEPAA